MIAQTKPSWLDATSRELSFPSELYYVGFAYGYQQHSESLDQATQRIQDQARANAVSSIQISVRQVVERISQNSVYTANGAVSASTIDNTNTTATLVSSIKDVPGLSTDLWVDASSNQIFAFSYIKKNDFQKKIEKRISVNITKVQMHIESVHEMIANGTKPQARDRIKECLAIIGDIENDQMILMAVDASLSEEDLSISETHKLAAECLGLQNQLAHGIFVKCDISAQIFDRQYSKLSQNIQKAMSDAGCSFVEESDEADFVVKIEATAREYNTEQFGTATAYFVYVDTDIYIFDSHKNRLIYSEQVSEKGSHTLNKVEAARDAYNKTEHTVSEIIIHLIETS